MAQKRYEFDNAVKILRSKKYKVLSDAYLPGKKLKCMCPNNHEWVVNIYDFVRKNYSCPKCSGNRKKKLSEVKRALSNFGYTFVSGEYKNCDSVITIECPFGHEYTTTWHKFNAGYRCKYCSNLFKKDLKYISDFMEEEGYTLLSKKYVNNKQKLEYICDKGHVGYTRWDRFQRGDRCMKCFKSNQSKNENHLFSYLKNEYSNLEIIKGDRKILEGKELDIYIPSKKLAIEYCGLYWHSEKQGKNKYYHFNKTKHCAEKGIRLITIFEDQYLANREKVYRRLKKVIENTDALIFDVNGIYLFSDLCWDIFESEKIYSSMGYVLLNSVKYRVHYFKKQTRVQLPEALQKEVGRFWDCGHKVYVRV